MKQLLSSSKAKSAPSPDAPAYDPRKRGPQYAHAFASPMYELVCVSCRSLHDRSLMITTCQLPLLNHYHPTIALHACQLLLRMYSKCLPLYSIVLRLNRCLARITTLLIQIPFNRRIVKPLQSSKCASCSERINLLFFHKVVTQRCFLCCLGMCHAGGKHGSVLPQKPQAVNSTDPTSQKALLET